MANESEENRISYTVQKDEPIGIENEAKCVQEIFHHLREISNDERFRITRFKEIKEATLKALYDLGMVW